MVHNNLLLTKIRKSPPGQLCVSNCSLFNNLNLNDYWSLQFDESLKSEMGVIPELLWTYTEIDMHRNFSIISVF